MTVFFHLKSVLICMVVNLIILQLKFLYFSFSFHLSSSGYCEIAVVPTTIHCKLNREKWWIFERKTLQPNMLTLELLIATVIYMCIYPYVHSALRIKRKQGDNATTFQWNLTEEELVSEEKTISHRKPIIIIILFSKQTFCHSLVICG